MNFGLASVRDLMTRKIGLTVVEIDELFEDFFFAVLEGCEPEQALDEAFGLDPGYLTDPEVWETIERGFAAGRKICKGES